MSRPRPTVADYMVIAISPMLIMAMVGSLVFYLLEVFYQGQYQGRLDFIMAMFVMAAVLIARISIEEGREYAMLFAIPLALVTALAMYRFVQFQGMLADFSIVVSLGLIALIWWSADRLTWDCTVIDESQDASGEGLLQTVGLEKDPSHSSAAASSAATTVSQEELEGTTTRDSQSAKRAEPTGLFSRFLEYRRRPHAPGVWVIYYSLAALPIFGLGQWLAAGSELEGRRHLFRLLVTYVAAALGLLVTTSFLGLRRYLRQRRLPMPAEMAAAWLAGGAILIVVLLLFCMLLPRRNPEYSVTQLPILAGSPDDLRTSRYGFGNDGPNEQGADRLGPQQGKETSEQSQSGGQTSDSKDQQRQPSDDPQSSRSQSQSPSGDQPSAEPGKQENSRGEKGESSSSGSSKSDSRQGKQSSGGNKSKEQSADQRPGDGESASGQRDQGKPAGSESSRPGSSQSDPQQEARSENQRPEGPKDSGQREEERTKAGDRAQQAKPSSKTPEKSASTNNATRPPRFNPTRLLPRMPSGVGPLLRLMYWIAVIAILGYLLWRYWPQVVQGLQNFMAALREFWQRLFGGAAAEAVAAEATMKPAVTLRPFAAYPDPFASGEVTRWSAEQLVRYSFEAFEAWARERGYPRAAEQTPTEFAQWVATNERQLAREALQLVELYNVLAYGRRITAPINVAPLRRLWQALHTQSQAT